MSSSEVWIQISLYDSQSSPPIPSYFFSRLGRQRNRCPPRLILSPFVFKTVLHPWVSLPDTVLCVSMEQSRILAVRSLSGPSVSLLQQDPICLGPSMKVSCMQICILLRDSVFRLTPVCLLSRGVLTVFSVRVASRFFDDEWCVSQIKSNVQELSSLICPDSRHTLQQHICLSLCVLVWDVCQCD